MKISVTRDGWEDYITWSNERTILKRPRCGFATSILGNALTAADEDEKATLRTIVATAERVWG